MKTLVIIRQINETQDRQTGEYRQHLEFEFQNPALISKVNITNQSTQFKNVCNELKGKEVLLSLQERQTDNGIKYWTLTDTDIQLVKAQSVFQPKAQAA